MILRPTLAELRVLWHRPGTWVLLAIWLLMSAMFGYVIRYIDRSSPAGPANISNLLPANVVTNSLAGFPFFGGVIVLILAVMTFGGDYGWGVIKTLLTQRSSRVTVFTSKFLALLVSLLPFVALNFGVGIVASEIVARLESQPADLQAASEFLLGGLAAWLILGVWAALGVLLATWTRGTSLAIGVGILYGLVFEGLLSALLNNVDLLSPLIEGLLRTNGYSLVQAIGNVRETVRDVGPGSFGGPYVDGSQAVIVLVAYLLALTGGSALIFQRRDVD